MQTSVYINKISDVRDQKSKKKFKIDTNFGGIVRNFVDNSRNEFLRLFESVVALPVATDEKFSHLKFFD